MRVIFTKIVRNVVSQGKIDNLTETNQWKALSNKNEPLNLNLEIKGEVPLPHGINADDRKLKL